MRNRQQFLIGCGSAAAILAVPSIVRATVPASRPDFVAETYDVPGLGSVRALMFSSDADRPAVSIVAAIVGRANARATVVTDDLPKIPVPFGETNGFAPRVSYSQTMDPSGQMGPITAQATMPLDEVLAAGRFDEMRQTLARRYRASSQLRDIAERYHAPIAINGGFFDATFAPKGLLIVNGRTVSQPVDDLSGAFVIDANGVPSVVKIADVSHPAFAVQSGPFLIEVGGALGVAKDPSWLNRTFVAQAGDKFVAGATTAVSLQQLAGLLKQFPGAFEVDAFDAALNMGGAATTGFFAQVNGVVVGHSEATLRSRDAILFGVS